MTKEQAIDYIENYTWSSTRLGLERTRELLSAVGDPQRKLKFIHVAGSNGKGSTCAMLSSILTKAGFRTGMYTSPHIWDFCERMQINGEWISGEDLAEITETVRKAADSMEDHPSQFELVTVIALEYFRRKGCDIVVLEVGMGGALDSTNAIDAPEAAVIMNIGLEHTEYLGSTLGEIAATKAGIIKPGCSAVCYDSVPEVCSVVSDICSCKQVPVSFSRAEDIQPVMADLAGQRFRWKGNEYTLGLLGKHQLRNAGVVLETVEVLRQRGWVIPEQAVDAGLAEAVWPARMEILGREPLFILDGGHNPQCAEALAGSLKTLLSGRKCVFLMGVLADKDYPNVIAPVFSMAEQFFCLTPVSPRALEANALAGYLASLGAKAAAFEQVAEAVTAAVKAAGPDGVVVSFGSLYLAGFVREEYLRLFGGKQE